VSTRENQNRKRKQPAGDGKHDDTSNVESTHSRHIHQSEERVGDGSDDEKRNGKRQQREIDSFPHRVEHKAANSPADPSSSGRQHSNVIVPHSKNGLIGPNYNPTNVSSDLLSHSNEHNVSSLGQSAELGGSGGVRGGGTNVASTPASSKYRFVAIDKKTEMQEKLLLLKLEEEIFDTEERIAKKKSSGESRSAGHSFASGASVLTAMPLP